MLIAIRPGLPYNRNINIYKMFMYKAIYSEPNLKLACRSFLLFQRNYACYLRNEFHFSGVHGAMNRSGSRAK